MRFLSEEAGEQGAPSAPLTAVIDPVDGSSNFERGIPYYCTSVAVARGRRLEDVCYALVEDLVSGDVYVGRSGSGATKNGAPARTSGRRELRSSVIAVDGSRVPRGELGRLAPLSAGARRVLHFGANALEICMVADGRLDAFVDLRGKLRVTDVAAALLVAEEAGAKATALRCDAGESGMSLAGRYSVVVASSEELHDEIVGSVGGLGRLP
jgi:myo-inositol-1(or 4)-monophosphatase